VKLKAIVHPADEGGYWAEVPALPGCVTQGETIEEIKRNLAEAVEGWLLAGQEGATDSHGQVLELAL
jgi:predicted RNase H-like HicB family nuclease